MTIASPYKEYDIDKLKSIWEPKKEYIEKDLWVIRNFLSEEELNWLNSQANDPENWYTTMRSPYGGNIKNKFLCYLPKYNDDGLMILPGEGEDSYQEDCVWRDFPIEDRLQAVVEKHFAGTGTLQSFFEVPDEEIIKELGHDVEYAMDWHYEIDESIRPLPEDLVEEVVMTAAISLYVNDDYDGGILEFKNKDYSIKPEAGMLVNIPIYKEFEHRVTKVKNGNRHTLYGKSYSGTGTRHISSNEDC